MGTRRSRTTGAKTSWLTASFNQRDAQLVMRLMRDTYDEAFTDSDSEQTRRELERENSLAELIADTEDMMKDAGFDPAIVPPEMTALGRAVLSCKDQKSRLMTLMTGIVGLGANHRVALYLAHHQLVCAKAAQDTGQPDMALRLTVLGAQFLVRSVASGMAEQRRKGANKAHATNPAHAAMTAIRSEFGRWQRHEARYRNDADFAKKMHAKYANMIANEGSIKNAVSRWREAK